MMTEQHKIDTVVIILAEMLKESRKDDITKGEFHKLPANYAERIVKLFAIPIVSERTFRTNDPDVEDIAEQIDSFILMYWKTKKAGTYSLKLRKYIAATLNRYVR